MLRDLGAFFVITIAALESILAMELEAHAGWELDGGIICYASHSQLDPEITLDTYGGAYVVWVDTRDGPQSDIYAQHVTASGSRIWYHTGIPICVADGDQEEAALVPDDAGGAIIVWTDRRGEDADIYAQRVDRHGTALWEENGIVVSDASNDQYDPTIIRDGEGGVIVVWTDGRNFGLDYSLDLYAQRLDANGNKLWASSGLAVYEGPGSQSKPDVLTDGSGGAFVAWQDTRNDSFEQPYDYDIFAAHVRGAGSVAWDREIVEVLYSQFDVRLVPDPEGGILLFWSDDRDQDELERDIYGSRCRADGGLLVPSDTGRSIVQRTNSQTLAEVVTDGSGGAILFWYHNNGVDHDIKAQRLNADLESQWVSGGIDVCVATDYQTDLRAIDDAYGGAIAVWVDRRNSSGRDIYTQRINSSGARVWEADGMPVCLDSSRQLMPALCTDSMGGALFAWHDQRRGTPGDIWGHHARSNGTLLPTLLRSSDVRWNGDAVRLTWQIFDGGTGLEWLVERSTLADGGYERLDARPEPQADSGWTVMDGDITRGETVRYRVSVKNDGGFDVLFVSDPVAVPFLVTRLLPARPNPFNPATNLEFDLARPGAAHLTVYDLAGREVRQLATGEHTAGRHRLRWDGRDTRGHAVPAGVYIARLATGDRVHTIRLSLVR
jgi:hypothetical protein